MAKWFGTAKKTSGKREPIQGMRKPKNGQVDKKDEEPPPRWTNRRFRLSAPNRIDVRFARQEE